MTANDKKSMFDQCRLDIHQADTLATQLHRNNSTTPDEASHLLRLCTKANASVQAWERAMRGVEPPKAG